MRPERRNADAGFTLTELLVVLILIGILTGVMLAEMRGTYEDALLRASARQLMNGLGLAGSRAVSLNQAHTFAFDPAKNEFTVQARENNSSSKQQDNSIENHPWMEVRKLDERVTVAIRDPVLNPEEIQNEDGGFADEPPEQITPDRITFYPDGTADRREILLRDRNNVELTLRINPITGRVRLEEEN